LRKQRIGIQARLGAITSTGGGETCHRAWLHFSNNAGSLFNLERAPFKERRAAAPRGRGHGESLHSSERGGKRKIPFAGIEDSQIAVRLVRNVLSSNQPTLSGTGRLAT
jgi:hypothetical protein